MRKGCRLAAASLILLLALALRVESWGENRFLEDEALYGYWGLQIAGGADPLLDHEPVDKPPVQPYLLALTLNLFSAGGSGAVGLQHENAARLPSLFASVTCIALVYALGDRWFGVPQAGLLAALLLALSPFDILFASTAFTDSLMTALVLGSLLTVTSGYLGSAGLMAGLAAATKQQGLFFLPLIIAAGLLARHQRTHSAVPTRVSSVDRESAPGKATPTRRLVRVASSRLKRFWQMPWIRFITAFAFIALLVLWWDSSRLQRPGFLEQSLISYGGLRLAESGLVAERAIGWLHLLSGFWGSLWLNAVVFAGILLWLVGSGRLITTPEGPRQPDWLIVGFVVVYLFLHWLLAFQLWDRYLLCLVPLVALLGGRAFSATGNSIRGQRGQRIYTVSLGLLFVLALLGPASRAAQGEYPFGGDHGAYDGIDALASYLRSEADPGSVVYHYWLGSHYRFYLHSQPLRLHWYPSLNDLAEDAYVYRRLPRYIAEPSWKSIEAARRALADIGIHLEPVFATSRGDGSTSFRLYRLVGP